MMPTVPDDPKPFPQRKHLTRIPVWLPLEQSVVYLVTACCAQRRKVFVRADTVRVGAECLGRIAERQGWEVVKPTFPIWFTPCVFREAVSFIDGILSSLRLSTSEYSPFHDPIC